MIENCSVSDNIKNAMDRKIFSLLTQAGFVYTENSGFSCDSFQDSIGKLLKLHGKEIIKQCQKEAEYEAARYPYAPDIREPLLEVAKNIKRVHPI